jgi:tRNA nucleotidyltransferase (CCA-adding enzyme)
MTDTGWGQIPVVERGSHTIIGIVTRTDLLKTLTPQKEALGRRNLAEKLASALPPARLDLLKKIAKAAQEQRAAIYIVGGFVRDLLLKRPSLDFDIVVEGDAIKLARAIQSKYGGRITMHKRFGTAKWFLEPIVADNRHLEEDGEQLATDKSQLPITLDFITARREFYTHPTALPTVESGSIKLDLHRRDFTINTLAIRLDGHHFGDLHDYWGGYNDLRQGLVRVLHSLSFIDDPTRMLRAVRYEQRYSFNLGLRTRQLLLAALPMLERISGDRVRHEIDKTLAEENAPQILDRLQELGILEAIHPDLIWDDWIKDHISNLELPPPEWDLETELKGLPLHRILAYSLWLARLPAKRSQRVTKRLRVPSVIAETVQNACHLWADLPSLKDKNPSIWTSRLEKVPVAAIYTVYCACDNPDDQRRLSTYITDWRHVSQKTTGHDLEACGLPPGPIYREILTQLRNAWLDGQVITYEDELSLLKHLVDEASDQSDR